MPSCVSSTTPSEALDLNAVLEISPASLFIPKEAPFFVASFKASLLRVFNINASPVTSAAA